jgi:2-polyprenyl-6-methoxyphenol hydroxylase-like FAD-dependent oxidoreductase
MKSDGYDLVLAGGGLAGSALAIAMAGRGARVLVLERETRFKDRVRGEGMTPWGVVEAEALGIDAILREAGGHRVPYWDAYIGPGMQRRDLPATTACARPVMAFYHPAVQEALLSAAAKAGAEVRRGVSVTGVEMGSLPRVMPRVVTQHEGRSESISARLVVAADGRGSGVRKSASFPTVRDETRLFIAGLLFEGASGPSDAVTYVQGVGRLAIFFPQGNGRVRAYFAYHKDLDKERLSGEADVGRFIEESIATGARPEWFEGMRPAGPLATFDGADTFTPHPYKDGVALVGDAAAASDPSWGQGLSLTLRDVRVLRDKLLETEDWDAAGHAYAAEHDRYYGTLRTMEDWITKLFMEVGPEADARRGRAIARMMEDPTRTPDVLLNGPDEVLDEARRRRFFGED